VLKYLYIENSIFVFFFLSILSFKSNSRALQNKETSIKNKKNKKIILDCLLYYLV